MNNPHPRSSDFSFQAAVSWLYVLPGKRNRDFVSWAVEIRLYQPKEWANDRKRTREVRVLEDISFLKKSQIGNRLIVSGFEENLPLQAEPGIDSNQHGV